MNHRPLATWKRAWWPLCLFLLIPVFYVLSVHGANSPIYVATLWPNNSWYNTYIAPWRSSIATKMQSCATSGYYYEVSSDSSITDALNALFQKAIAVSHLTN